MRRVCTLVSGLLAILAAAPVAAERPLRVALTFHVAAHGSAAPIDPNFLSEQLAQANAIYTRHGLTFAAEPQRSLPARHRELRSRAERDALAQYLRPEVVNCFVVARLMDVDEPGRERRGVHWKPRHAPARRFVILSQIAGPYVLAHELGHYFGNPIHSTTPGNLMSYERTAELPFLDPLQVARVKATLSDLLAHGTLRALP